jgi:hypothetical protein
MMNAIDFASSHLLISDWLELALYKHFYEVASLAPAAKANVLAGLSGTTKVVPFP